MSVASWWPFVWSHHDVDRCGGLLTPCGTAARRPARSLTGELAGGRTGRRTNLA